MSLADYQRDTAHSGLDQVERLHMWARLGALIVDFPYVQPALSAEQEADDTLLYSVLGARSDTLDACLLLAHLERFFSISVLKGQPLASSPAAQSQIDVLRKSCAAQGSVRLLAPQAAIQRLRESREELAKTANSTRDLARE
jgi:hypothetical protein